MILREIITNISHYVKSVRIRSFLIVFSCIQTENEEIRRIYPYSVQMRENKGQKNSEYGHLLLTLVFK